MWMATGFSYPTASPKKVWLLTVFGQKTDIRTYGLTLLLPPLVDKVEIPLLKVDHDFKLTKPVVCTIKGCSSKTAKGRQIEGYVDGVISVSMVADDKDDPTTVLSTEWKSGGQKLRDFDNVGGMNGVKSQLDDILTTWIQHIADHNSVDMLWMETHGLEIGNIILQYLVGLKAGELKKSLPPVPRNIKKIRRITSNMTNARGLGVKFTKFEVNLKPSDSKVIDARNRYAVEEAQRTSELLNTETMNENIRRRAGLSIPGWKSGDPIDLTPDQIEKIRAGIVQEILVDNDKATLIMNKDGITLTDTRKN